MYCLYFIPAIINALVFALYHVSALQFESDAAEVAYAVFLLLLTPIYLLTVHKHLVKNKAVAPFAGIVCSFACPLLNTLCFMVDHKIKTGLFIGDVPTDIYCSMFGIPALIILLVHGINQKVAIKKK